MWGKSAPKKKCKCRALSISLVPIVCKRAAGTFCEICSFIYHRRNSYGFYQHEHDRMLFLVRTLPLDVFVRCWRVSSVCVSREASGLMLLCRGFMIDGSTQPYCPLSQPFTSPRQPTAWMCVWERQRGPFLLVATLWLTGLGWLPAALGQVPRAWLECVWTADRQEPAIGLGGEVTWPRISPLPRCANTKRVCVCVCATHFLSYLLFPVQTLTFSQVSLIIRQLESVFATASVRSS